MLKIEWSSQEPPVTAGQVLVVPVRDADDLAKLDASLAEGVAQSLGAARFKGRPADLFKLTLAKSGTLQQVLIIGVGAGLSDALALRKLAHDAVRQANRLGAETMVLDLRSLELGNTSLDAAHMGALVAQGFELGSYAYDRFIAEDKRTASKLRSVTVLAATTAPSEGTARGQAIASGITLARDLANGPPALVTPTFLAETAKNLATELQREGANVEVTILERAECEARQMGCYLGVSLGSESPPKFIHLRYVPKGVSKGRIALIGKGVTFDSGGYSLKPSDSMLDMKMDMAGGATVIGAFSSIVRLQLPWEVHAICAATENLVSGRAYKLGDVLRASNGKTVEINNTDAEGRLTLADAMVYASKLEPDCMIDFATLTGACMIALGPQIAGVMTQDEALASTWMDAARAAGEPMWRLPLPEHLKEQLKSPIADMKNTGERWGGALTAGLFLSEFTEGRRWMHVDIAGPAMASKPYGVTIEGGTGFAVASILEFLDREPTWKSSS